jgi:dTDP-4-amino-4,6-dideoxygalactose transaminase
VFSETTVGFPILPDVMRRDPPVPADYPIPFGGLMQVPFFRYPHVYESHKKALDEAISRVISRGAFIMQQDLASFEDQLADYTGAADVVGIGNATDGLEMIIADAGIGPGDEVILPAHTFIASASAVVAAGATPVFAEIAADHLLDPADAESRITERTRAIMPTQLNGRVGDMESILDLAKRHELVVLEDSAQGIGALYHGKMAGTFGSGGVLSFYPAKVLGCMGDGGAILTMDEEAGRRFRQVRDHGRDPSTGEVERWGRNTRLDNLQAAVLLVKLATLDEEIGRRRELGSRYDENLRDVAELTLPPRPEAEGVTHFDTFQNYEVTARDRDELRKHLSENGVGTILQWGGKAVHQFPALGFECSLPRTEKIMSEAFLLPMNNSLTLDEVDYVCEQVRAFCSSGKAGRI